MLMKTNSSCCGGSSTSSCTNSIAELPRYYPRQLITPADLTLEQDYFRDRLRRHNRLLHGWGVVCGALVCPVSVTNADGTISYSPWLVQVQPGYILGPYGDEILLDCPRTVDVRTQGVFGVTGETCIDAPDPWCTEVFTPPTTTTPTVYYIAVKYLQSMTRPVRVQPVGCGCDDSSCEYSRWHDGYQIGVLNQCPTCSQPDDKHPLPKFDQLMTGSIPTCPDCSCGPWVGLAAVTVNSDGTIAQIDNCSCRRMVLSFASFWWRCSNILSSLAVTGAPIQVTIDPQNLKPITVTVTGSNLDLNAKYIFGPGSGLTMQTAVWTPNTTPGTSVDLSVNMDSSASPGMYRLTVINPDCNTALVTNAINVAGMTSALKTAAAPKGGAAVVKPKKAPAPTKG
jgi:hypothetical protein